MYPVSLQTFIDTPNCVFEDRVQYSVFHIPNVFCDGHLQIINCVGIVHNTRLLASLLDSIGLEADRQGQGALDSH
jgi:hypothetical protein